jgi:hypothetical protein
METKLNIFSIVLQKWNIRLKPKIWRLIIDDRASSAWTEVEKMSSGIEAIYDNIFSEMRKIEDILVLLRDDCPSEDEAKKARIKHLEGEKSELYQRYNAVYRDSSSTIMDKLQAIKSDVRNSTNITSVVA